MKKGLKFWSKLLIASFFLGGMATSAMAQNGATTANCGTSLITVTRTANEVNAGTEITLRFSGTTETPIVAGDSYYFVAENGGSLLTVGCDNTIGANLQVVEVNGVLNTIEGDESPIVAAGTFADVNGDDVMDEITVKVKSVTTLADAATTLKLGVFVKDEATGCYSDVNWVTIQVLGNIYASLTLNGTNPYEYICHGATTSTNIGFTLCNLPDVTGTITVGTLNYTVTATPTANITGQRVYASGNTGADLDANDSPWSATITGINAEDITIGSYTYSKAYTVKIGTQTLSNANPSAAEQIVYSFSNMTYTYTDNGRTVVLPIVFETESAKCNDRGIYDSTFTVHVAPSFGVQALAFKEAATRNAYAQDPAGTMSSEATLLAPEFCQGTLGYFRAINSTTHGTVNYTWTGRTDIFGSDTTQQGGTYNGQDQTSLIPFTNVSNNNPYGMDVVGVWNLDGNYGAGCQAKDRIDITIKKAPILLVATDKSGDAADWNSTDKITAPNVCPGNPIALGVDNVVVIDADVVHRTDYMNAGDFVRDNKNAISWTVSPYANPAGNVAAYTDWRSTAAPQTGDLSTGGDTPTLTPVAHFLNNSTDANANVIYTIESTGECALVKSNGMPLTDGKVQVIYPVEPRPQFQLGAN